MTKHLRAWNAALALALTGSASAGCAGTFRVVSLDDVERIRATAAAREGAALAPQAFAEAEHERDLARLSHAASDDVAATLHAEHAIAGYEHAVVLARHARAVTEQAEAKREADDSFAEARALEETRAQLDRQTADIESRASLEHDRLLPAPSGPVTPEREAARLVAARSLTLEARLLCGAAKLLAPEGDGVAAANAAAQALGERLDHVVHPAPVDDAARARARCLALLTSTRRGLGEDRGQSDALLAELSAAGGWDPARDERGVYVTLRSAFEGARLTTEAAARLRDLARVATAHPAFALQVVVHDAVRPAARGDEADAKRARDAVQALVAGGAADSRIATELARANAPLADPSEPLAAKRNERLEVVFVGP